MILDNVLRSLQIVLGEAMVTSNCDITAGYAIGTATTFTPAAFATASNGTAPVTVVAAPALAAQHQVNEVRLHNNDTVAHTVILRLNDSGVARILMTQTVAAGADFLYTPAGGVASLAGYALLASPTFTGAPTAPTAAAGTSTTQLATTAFAVAVANAPGTLTNAVDDTAAAAAGVAVGHLYRNGSIVMQRIV